MHHATDQVKGFYAKTKKPARSNLPVRPAFRGGSRFASALRKIYANVGFTRALVKGTSVRWGMPIRIHFLRLDRCWPATDDQPVGG